MQDIDKYFGKNEITEYKCRPCKKNWHVTELRKKGDLVNQYVINIYYCDTLYFSYDKSKVYSRDDENSDPVYSSYHSECEYCLDYKVNVKKNLSVGYRIYPRGIKPEKSYRERKIYWQQFQ